MLVVAPVFAIAGAISAMGTLMLARRTEAPKRTAATSATEV